jgi:NADH-quinone oxidoreductase subunit G
MTVTTPGAATPATQPLDGINVSVDGIEVNVPKGTLVIRVAEQLGVAVPRFCDHPLLDPVAACRMCLVEIEGQPKPQPACAITVTEGMKVRTQLTSEIADQAQKGVMEFLLINHPLDCPICDKGGECPLQNQAMANGRGETRFDGVKRTFPKPINVSAQILLDRERCVSCARCTRFAEQIAGDPFIDLLERGAKQQVGIGDDTPFDSYFSGNTIQICPVGALTSAKYRFRSRPFDLVSTPTICEHCASGCSLRTDVRRSAVLRRQAWDNPDVNEEWNCDKGRFAFGYQADGRIEHPLVRDESGELVAASWPEAIAIAAEGLKAAGSRSAVFTGGRLTVEDAYSYAKFARVVLGTDNIDFRSRTATAEEADFLAAHVAGRFDGPSYADLEAAPVVLLVDLEPEDESPIVFLRLRKASRHGVRVASIAPFASSGLTKLKGSLIAAAPGQQPALIASLTDNSATSDAAQTAALLREQGSVILVGERAAQTPGTLAAVADLARTTGAKLAWIPRRAGERGAVDAGALPGLLPGGRPLDNDQARVQVAGEWGIEIDQLPPVGLSLTEVVSAVHADNSALASAADPTKVERSITALLIAGVEAGDLEDPAAFLMAVDSVPFVVSLEQRHSDVTQRADVVLPVAAAAEKAGAFTNWEGRTQTFGQVLRDALTMSDSRVLAMIATDAGSQFGRGDIAEIRSEFRRIGPWSGNHTHMANVESVDTLELSSGEALVSTWRPLLDRGVLQEGDPYLAATARPVEARLSRATADAVGAAEFVVVSTDTGSIKLPVTITQMPDGVIWLPTNSEGSSLRSELGIGQGSVVRLSGGAA